MTMFDDVAKVGLGLLIGYVGSQYILYSQFDATSWDDAKGYIYGLVRGAGSRERALANLEFWKNYWLKEKPHMEFWINELYKIGLKQVALVWE
jgi:hypothetical protein